MIKSMTSYARADVNEDGIFVEAEIKTYNSRTLDMNIKIPHGFGFFDDKIRKFFSGKMTRGRIEIRLSFSDETQGAVRYEVDSVRAEAYLDAVKTLQATLELQGDVPIETVLAQSGIITPADVVIDEEKYWVAIEACLEQAYLSLDTMRAAEGQNLYEDLIHRLGFIATTVDFIEANANDLLAVYQQRLTDRIKALTDGVHEIDEARIAQEAALLADKSDISEEIVRAKSHLKQLTDILDGDEPGGRKINFLLQEFNREFNTMGAKSGNAGISHKVVEVKSELEKIREQIQNVE